MNHGLLSNPFITHQDLLMRNQLNISLWHRGYNVALDPGTFQYNGLPPWDNGLARTLVHNTVSINYTDQMLQAGRFFMVGLGTVEKYSSKNENMICAETLRL